MSIPHDRNGCALQGATRLLEAISGVVPVLHANAGCSVALDAQGAHSNEIASTVLQEKQVVFGGTARLREQIKNTVQVRAGDLYVVLSACVSEVIGDDVPAMVKEAREQRFPVIGVAVPGFRGHGWSGYATAAQGLLAQLPGALENAALPAETFDVNLLGIVPGLDPGWDSALQELEALLAELGLRSNRLVGYGQGVAAWQAATRARLNLLLSPWGAEAAAWLQQAHGIPSLDFGWLPVGSLDSGLLLAQVGEVLAIDKETVARARERLDARLRHVLHDASARGLLGNLHQRTAVVGGSAAAVGQARFLAGTLGLQVKQVLITDNPPEALRPALIAAVSEVAGAAAEVSFLTSRHAIDVLLRASAPELILGSALEAHTAQVLGAAFVETATPVLGRPFLGRSLAGLRGAVTLLEDILAASHAAAARAARHPQASASVVPN
jgi:nitrogenase molybdenum-iron protein beta chain